MAKQKINGDQLGTTGGAWTSYTPTQTGWASTTTLLGRYIQIGKTVIVDFNVSGTSNATSCTLTLPVAAKNTAGIYYESMIVAIQDNGANPVNPGKTFVDTSTNPNIMTLYKDISGGAWTATGGKSVRSTLIYEAA